MHDVEFAIWRLTFAGFAVMVLFRWCHQLVFKNSSISYH